MLGTKLLIERYAQKSPCARAVYHDGINQANVNLYDNSSICDVPGNINCGELSDEMCSMDCIDLSVESTDYITERHLEISTSILASRVK